MSEEVETFKEQLQTVEDLLSASPDDGKLLELKSTLVKKIAELVSSSSSFTIGQKVEALFIEDNCWYPAVINGVSGEKYIVTYEGWGNSEELSGSSIRQPTSSVILPISSDTPPANTNIPNPSLSPADITEGENEKKDRKEKGAIGLTQITVEGVTLKVPKYLIIQDADTDTQKSNKRKKIHSLICRKRNEEREEEQRKKQKEWQSFQKKINAKGKVNILDTFAKSPASSMPPVGLSSSGGSSVLHLASPASLQSKRAPVKRGYFKSALTANDLDGK